MNEVMLRVGMNSPDPKLSSDVLGFARFGDGEDSLYLVGGYAEEGVRSQPLRGGGGSPHQLACMGDRTRWRFANGYKTTFESIRI